MCEPDTTHAIELAMDDGRLRVVTSDLDDGAMRPWIALACAVACTRTDLDVVDLSDRSDIIAFIAVFDEGAELLRVTRVFGVEEGRIAFGDRPQLELTGDEAIAVLVELDRSDLAEEHPDLVLTRASEIAVRIETPPLSPALGGDPEAPEKRLALPEATSMLEVATESAVVADSDRGRAILERITMTLPVDPEYCRPSIAFEPFGAETKLLDSTNRFVRSIEKVIALGDRVLLASGVAMHVLERGGSIDTARSWDARVFDAPGAMTFIRDFDVSPLPNPDGSLKIIALPARTPLEDSLTVELRLDDVIELVRTATQVGDTTFADVEINGEGTAAWLSQEAVLYLEENGATTQRLLDPTPDPRGGVMLWLDPDRLIATSRNRFHFWDRTLNRLDTAMVMPPTERSLAVEVLRGGSEIWAGANNGWLARVEDGSIEEITIEVPPRYAGCSTAQGDPTLFEDDVIDLVLAGEYAYVLLRRCSAVMAIRTRDRCVSLLDPDGATPHLVDEKEEGLRTIELRDGELLLGDAQGRLFRAGL